MFGDQILSNRNSNPKYGFGTAGRQSSFKLFHTKEQTAGNVGIVGPGPIYDVPSSVGLQNNSRKNSAPAYRFGARAASDANLQKEARPGPGTYAHTDSLGMQWNSKKNTSSAWKFGSSNRWTNFKSDFKPNFQTPGFTPPNLGAGWLGDAPMYSMGTSGRYVIGSGNPGSKPTFMNAPGPGLYQYQAGFGAQPLSNRESAFRTRFGTATREKTHKVYLTHAHERELIGQHSPAPNKYQMKSSLGMQLSSTNPSSANFKFGSSDRFSEIKTAGKVPMLFPGPGSYGV